MVRPEREPLAQAVQIDEARGKRGAKSMVLVATNLTGACASHTPTRTMRRRLARRRPRPRSRPTGLPATIPEACRRPAGAADRACRRRPSRSSATACKDVHWTESLLKRWLLGTHAGAVKAKHLQAYLDEFAFRFNRRKTNGVGASRPAPSSSSSHARSLTIETLIHDTVPCRAFRS